jgi:hypothetical protein
MNLSITIIGLRLLFPTVVVAIDGGPDFSELNGSDDDDFPSGWTCLTKYYTLAQLIRNVGTAILTSMVCSAPSRSHLVTYIFRVRPCYADGTRVPPNTIEKIKRVSPFVERLLSAIKSGSSGSIEAVLKKMYQKSCCIMYGELEALILEAPVGMELFTERVLQFVSSQYPSFDEYSTWAWETAKQVLKDIKATYSRSGWLGGAASERLGGCCCCVAAVGRCAAAAAAAAAAATSIAGVGVAAAVVAVVGRRGGCVLWY